MEKLNEELATIKMMIYSLYKSVTLDENLDGIKKWEDECRKLAKEQLRRQKERDKQ